MEDPEKALFIEGSTKIDLARRAIRATLANTKSSQPTFEKQLSALKDIQTAYVLQAQLRHAELKLENTKPDPSLPEIGRQRLDLVKQVSLFKRHVNTHEGQRNIARKNPIYQTEENRFTPLVKNLEEVHKEDIGPKEVSLYEQMSDDLSFIIQEVTKN